jgi:hypothetical protein
VPLELRTGSHKLTVELRSSAGEMHDMEKNPGEMTNLFDEQAARSVRRELEDLLHKRPGAIRKAFDEPVGMA